MLCAACNRRAHPIWPGVLVRFGPEAMEVDTGIRFLRGREADWGHDNLFTVHNWWHLGLFLLEAERAHDALRIDDDHVHNSGSAGVPLEMLDASALLWRMHLDEIDVGGRFAPLADAWTSRTSEPPWYVFNDLHAVMSLAGGGRLDDAHAVIERLGRYVETAPDPAASNTVMTATIGLPACRATVAFAEGRYQDVVTELLPIRTTLARAGGSHAQRDVLQRTILTAAIRSGQLDLARALIRERLAVRESSVYSLRRLADVHRLGGEEVAGRAHSRNNDPGPVREWRTGGGRLGLTRRRRRQARPGRRRRRARRVEP